MLTVEKLELLLIIRRRLFRKRAADIGMLDDTRRCCSRPGWQGEGRRLAQHQSINDKSKQLALVRQIRASILFGIAVDPRIGNAPYVTRLLQADAIDLGTRPAAMKMHRI